jgi:riboflavin kinase/FMN adenylyltransferase
LNLSLEGYHLPVDQGIYAGYVTIGTRRYPAAIHYGPRPMLGDPAVSLEAHLLDIALETPPASATLELIAFIRSIEGFPDEAALKRQIKADIVQVRRVLGTIDRG